MCCGTEMSLAISEQEVEAANWGPGLLALAIATVELSLYHATSRRERD